MKIAYNPTDKPNITSEQLGLFNKDIIFDLSGLATYARGVQVGKVYQKFLKSTNSTTIGYDGLVPFPDYNSNSKNRFLKEDGTWVIPDAGTFDGMDSDRFVTTHNISEADTDKRSINVRFEPKWTDTNSSSYILRVGSSTEGLPDNNCGDGNLLHIQGRFSDTAFLLLSGWYNNSLYFRSGNEVDGVDNTTKEEADTGLFKNAWNRIPFFTDLTGSNIKLTGYLLDANNFESITSNDTVSSALSKLECKALFVYSWLTSDADDTDEKINKWHEVEHFLEEIEETTLNSILNTKADKETTLAGYGITDAMPYLGAVDANSVKSSGYAYVTANGAGGNGSLIAFGGTSYQTQLYADYLGGNLYWRVNANGTYTSWAKIATKGTTLAHYGITDAVKYCYGADDIRHSASGYTQITHGGKVNGMLLSGIYKETSLYGGQLNGAFDGSSIWYRGLNNGTFTEWKRLAFKETTLSGYGITDAVTLNTEQTITRVKTFTNGIKTPIIVNQTSDNALFIGATDNYYCDLNTQLSPGYSAIIPLFQKIGSATSTTGDFGSARKGVIRLSGNASESQLLFDHYNATIHYRGSTSNGAFTEWKRIAFTDDVVTLNTNQTISGVKTLSANLLSATRGTLDIGDEYNSFNRIFAWHYKPNSLTKPILSSGKWYRIWNFSQGVAGTFQKNAIISINKSYKYEQGQTITLAVSINNWEQTYVINQLSGTTGLITKVRVTGKWNYSYVDVYISSAENAESYSVSGYGNGERVDFEELADDATNDSTRTEELTVVNGTAVNYPLSLQNATPLVVNSTTMVANLNANYLGGLNKDSFQKAVYDYVNVSGTADTTALPTVIAPSIYNGTNSIGGEFKFYDTKFFSTQTKTSNRCQLAYGYDVDSIHFRRYKDGTWYDWKKVVFTEGTDNLKITNSSARTTYVKDSTHSMFFGYSDGSYNRGLYDNSLSNWIMYTDSSNQTFINQWLGNVGIKTGNATLTAALQVGGSILASGDITAYSDRRLKSNIQTLENRGYVEPVTFEKDGKQCIGFIAQDVEEKYPELVNSEGEYLSLNYQQYTAVLQALIIELDKRIKELENGFSKL